MINVSLNIKLSKRLNYKPHYGRYSIDGAFIGKYYYEDGFYTFSDPYSVFDRSDSSKFNTYAREGFYDESNPFLWHKSELTIDNITKVLINQETIYFSFDVLDGGIKLDDVITFTETQRFSDAEKNHAIINNELLSDSNDSVLFDKSGLPLWDK